MRERTTLVRVLHGSRLHGTATAASDTDYKSVHLPAGRDILLQRARGVVARAGKADPAARNAPGDVDDESYALHKFLALLADGDMLAIETLFAPEACVIERRPAWDRVAGSVPRLVNRECRGFVGYCRKQVGRWATKGGRVAATRAAAELFAARAARAPGASVGDAWEEALGLVAAFPGAAAVETIRQADGRGLLHLNLCATRVPVTLAAKAAGEIYARRLAKFGERALRAEDLGGADWKALAHALRVARQAIEFLGTGRITFPRPEAPRLLAVRRGEVPLEAATDELEALLRDVERAQAASVLPEAVDPAFGEALLLDLYGEQCRP